VTQATPAGQANSLIIGFALCFAGRAFTMARFCHAEVVEIVSDQFQKGRRNYALDAAHLCCRLEWLQWTAIAIIRLSWRDVPDQRGLRGFGAHGQHLCDARHRGYRKIWLDNCMCAGTTASTTCTPAQSNGRSTCPAVTISALSASKAVGSLASVELETTIRCAS
jgi:hypothetical protein